MPRAVISASPTPFAAEQVAATGGLLVERVHESHGADPMRRNTSPVMKRVAVVACERRAHRRPRHGPRRAVRRARRDTPPGRLDRAGRDRPWRRRADRRGFLGRDGVYRGKLGDLVLDRADTVVWIDLPSRVAAAACTADDRALRAAQGAVEPEQGVPRSVLSLGLARSATRSTSSRAVGSATRTSSRGSASRASARKPRSTRSAVRRRSLTRAARSGVRHPILSRTVDRAVSSRGRLAPGSAARPEMPANGAVDDSAHIRREGTFDADRCLTPIVRSSPSHEPRSEARWPRPLLAGRATRA